VTRSPCVIRSSSADRWLARAARRSKGTPPEASHCHWRSPWITNHCRGLRKTKTHVRRCSPSSAHHRNSSNHMGLSCPPCATTDLRRLRRPGARRSSSAPQDVDKVEPQLHCRCSSPFRPARSSLEPNHPSQE
jgi:hypothetical protein